MTAGDRSARATARPRKASKPQGAKPGGARMVARDLLIAILERGRFLDEAMAANGEFAALSARDRGFARLIAVTVLRRLGQIDALLAHCIARPLPRKEEEARAALRMGAAQLLFLDTPAHAAVGETVATVPPHVRGLVNAVLRRLGREGAEGIAGQDAARLNCPDWLWQSWTAAYDEAGARAIAEAHLAEPPLDLTLRDPATAADWATRLGGQALPGGTLRLTGAGAVPELAGFAEGAWWIQDRAATLPARLLGGVAGQRIVDLCAAPGGKTLQLAAAGARVMAVEASEQRLQRVTENLARTGLQAETVAADGRVWRPDTPVDAVLLDAPCSGTGAIRRHPDIQRIKGPEDPVRMAAVQDALLDAAIQMVRPGGRIVFCTCSLQPEEGPDRIAALLARGAPVRRIPIAAGELPGLAEAATAEGDLRTLPGMAAAEGGLDGFYAVRLERL
ncbi:MAG: MFS transporter [Rhodospirillaceae bacterium]|jgi:16S rRNA (cytosine967-C5)-methyltransferase|nr:MFS transporter [Rhodospirillaceae bacterium]MBT6117691.1 MFS transporter [Rhodospirillaceae bacterium]